MPFFWGIHTSYMSRLLPEIKKVYICHRNPCWRTGKEMKSMMMRMLRIVEILLMVLKGMEYNKFI